jgi:hypothetical protein
MDKVGQKKAEPLLSQKSMFVCISGGSERCAGILAEVVCPDPVPACDIVVQWRGSDVVFKSPIEMEWVDCCG